MNSTTTHLSSTENALILEMIQTFKSEMALHTQQVEKLLEGAIEGFPREEVKFFSKQLVSYFNFVPASVSFRYQVKRRFNSQPQINFTLQNFLTWHFIDHVLVDYLRDERRFASFEACASTEFDRMQVDTLKSLLGESLSLEQIRFFYFKQMGRTVLSKMFFHHHTEASLTAMLQTFLTKGERELSAEEIYQLQPFFSTLTSSGDVLL